MTHAIIAMLQNYAKEWSKVTVASRDFGVSRVGSWSTISLFGYRDKKSVFIRSVTVERKASFRSEATKIL